MRAEEKSGTPSFRPRHMIPRASYVKPVVMQLHYATEPDVAIAQVCKTTGSTSGPTVSGCLTTIPVTPCVGGGS